MIRVAVPVLSTSGKLLQPTGVVLQIDILPPFPLLGPRIKMAQIRVQDIVYIW